jgi:hypothetical protein
MTTRRALFALVTLAATMTLSACIPGATAGTSPTAPPISSAPSSEPTPTREPVAASVTVSAEAIAVLDETGATLASYDYFTPTAEVVAGLTAHLGAPVDSAYPGGLEMPPGTVHEWGGLSIVDTGAPV